jgi:hypothetical protein
MTRAEQAERDAKITELNNLGWDDSRIAKFLNLGHSPISERRRGLGLPRRDNQSQKGKQGARVARMREKAREKRRLVKNARALMAQMAMLDPEALATEDRDAMVAQFLASGRTITKLPPAACAETQADIPRSRELTEHVNRMASEPEVNFQTKHALDAIEAERAKIARNSGQGASRAR